MERWTGGWRELWTDRRMGERKQRTERLQEEGQKHERTDRAMDGRKERRTDGWSDGRTTQIEPSTFYKQMNEAKFKCEPHN